MIENNGLPLDWAWTTVGDIAKNIQYGHTESANAEKVGPKFLRITDIQEGSVNWETVPYCVCTDEQHEKYRLNSGDIVFARTGATTGKSFLIQNPPDAVFASYLIRLQLETQVSPKYLSLYFQSSAYWNQIISERKGVAQPGVNASILSTLKVPLPPFPEQNRIVEKIEELFTQLDAGVAELQTAKAQLQRYRQAVLKSAVEGELTREWREEHIDKLEPASVLLERILAERRAKWEAEGGKGEYKEPIPPNTDDLPALPDGWSWASPEQLASPERYALAIGPFGSNLKVSDYTDYGIPLVFVRNIRSGIFDGPGTHFVSEEKARELRAHQIKGDDILITKMGEPPGDACIYPTTRPPAIITADCVKWTLSPYLTENRYIVHSINSPLVRSQIIKITKGVAQKKISLARFKTIAIPIPPLHEQELLAEIVERSLSVADEIERQLDQSLTRGEQLRQSILKRAFEGKLVRQNPQNESVSII